MKNPSGSSLQRGWECAASFALHQAPNTGGDAIAGSDKHEGIEVGISTGDLSQAPRVVRELVEGATMIEVEMAFALDVEAETVRYLGSRIGRHYGQLRDTEIALTLDALITHQDRVVIVDWKSRKRVTAAKKNLQLRAQCVAAMKHIGLSSVDGIIAYLDDGEQDVHVFDAFDVPVFFADMRAMLNRIGAARALVATGGMPEVHSGPWCEYCPALAYCPAQTRLALTMLDELREIQSKVAFLSPEQCGRAWTIKKQVETLLEKVDGALRLRAQQEIIPLPNGKRLALVEKSRSNFDAKKAKAWISDHGGDLKEFEGRTHFSQIAETNMPAVAVAADHE